MTDIVRGDQGDKSITIGPLERYSCDGISIRPYGSDSNGKQGYQLYVHEKNDGQPFKVGDLNEFGWSLPEEVGSSAFVALNDEEMEALFLAWQILKKERKS